MRPKQPVSFLLKNGLGNELKNLRRGIQGRATQLAGIGPNTWQSLRTFR
jgi:hypothetical protein